MRLLKQNYSDLFCYDQVIEMRAVERYKIPPYLQKEEEYVQANAMHTHSAAEREGSGLLQVRWRSSLASGLSSTSQ